MQPQSAREFSIAVSDIVRSYIERGFDLTATHRKNFCAICSNSPIHH